MTVGLVFFFNILMFFLYAIFSSIRSSKLLNFIFVFIASFITALYASSRDLNYGDTLNYVKFYRYEYTFINFEPLFDGLARIFIKLFPFDPIYFLFFCALLTSSLLFFSYRKLLGGPVSYLACWILLSTFSFHYLLFEAIRQGISIAFLLLAITYLVKDKNWIKYYLFLFIGIGFHYSIIPFIFLPIFSKFKNKYFYILFFIIVGIFGKTILMKFGNLVGVGVISDKLEFYSDLSSESKTILIRNLIFIFTTPFVYHVLRNNKYYFNVYFLYVVLLAITLSMDEVNRRYLFVGPIFLIPVLWIYLKNKKNGILFLLILTFLYFYIFLINYWSMYGILNYKPLIDVI